MNAPVQAIAVLAQPTRKSTTNKDGWEARTEFDLPNNHRLKFYTYRMSRTRLLTTVATVCLYENREGYSAEQFSIGIGGGGDYYKTLEESAAARVTEKAVNEQHDRVLAREFDKVVQGVIAQYGEAMGLTTPAAGEPKDRTIREIALEIKRLWTKPYFGAVPYLDAMMYVDKPDSTYGAEDGKTQVIYFLSNATTWRGEDAKRIKAELKKICGIK